MSDDMKHATGWHDVRQVKSGKWEARWADETGTARGKCFLTKPQAQKYSWDMANGVINTQLGLAVSRKDIREALDEFLGRRLDPKTTALNERRINEFLTAMPEVMTTGHLTDRVINKYAGILVTQGHNPGGQHHHLKIVRAFCRFCVAKRWLGVNPFEADPSNKFKMPKSKYEGRALTPEEFERMISIGWTGNNQHAEGEAWAGRNQYTETDAWLNKAIRFGRETMLRISQVWKLTPKDFKDPELWIEGIKGQPGVWITLRPQAAQILRELMTGRRPDQRFFDYWKSVESMRNSVHDKAHRVGLPGVRFHDACKVTRVSELDAAGYGLGDISALANTTKRVLSDHYIKADRRRAFAKYQDFKSQSVDGLSSGSALVLSSGSGTPENSYRAHTESIPENGSNGAQKVAQAGINGTISTDENSATSPQISEL